MKLTTYSYNILAILVEKNDYLFNTTDWVTDNFTTTLTIPEQKKEFTIINDSVNTWTINCISELKINNIVSTSITLNSGQSVSLKFNYVTKSFTITGRSNTSESPSFNNVVFTGTTTLAQNATSDLQAVTLQQLRSEQMGWNKIIIFGDSRIANESATVSNITYNYNRGVINWANAILDKRFEIISNKGVGGNKTADLLARYDSDIKPYAGIVKIIYMMIDVNDVNADVPEATIKTNLTSLYDKMTQDGFFIIDTLGYYPVTALSAARQRVFQNISQFKRIQAHSRKNMRVLDCHAIIGNVTLTSPTTNTNMMFDGTLHIGVRASQLLGIELAKILAQLCPKTDRLINSAGDFRSTSDNTISKNLILNPLMIGTTGTNGTGSANDASLDSGFTAGVATSMTSKRNSGTGSIATSVGTNTNFIGQVQRLKITGETTATATYQFAPTSSVHGIVTKGVPLTARCKVQLSNIAFVHTVMLRVIFTVDGVTYGSRDMADSNYVGGAITKDCILTLETLPVTIPSSGVSVTNCEAQILVIFDTTTSKTGTITLDIGQFSFEELS